VLWLRRLGVNRYADWTQEEYEALVLPTKARPHRPHPLADGHTVRLHAPTVAPAMLPATVDWRGTLVDSPVKDQAACGSCWVRAPLSDFGLTIDSRGSHWRELLWMQALQSSASL